MNSILEQIKSFCKEKSIVVVGNSSRILDSDYGKYIDSHDIIVRINGGCPINKIYYEKLGRRTDIYVVSYKNEQKIKKTLSTIKPLYVLRLNDSVYLSHPMCYFSENEERDELKSKFKNCKPSTGSMVINFFKKHIDYKELVLIGFDFFKSIDSLNRPNVLGSYLYKDHNPEQESAFILSMIDEKTKLIKI